MTACACAVLAETLAAAALALQHDVRHHHDLAGLIARLRHRPPPPATAHRHWLGARPRHRRTAMVTGVLADAGLALAWLAGYQLLVTAVLAVSLAACAAAWTTIPRLAQGGRHGSHRSLLPDLPAPAPRRH